MSFDGASPTLQRFILPAESEFGGGVALTHRSEGYLGLSPRTKKDVKQEGDQSDILEDAQKRWSFRAVIHSASVRSIGWLCTLGLSSILLAGSLGLRFFTATVTYSDDPTHQWVLRSSPGWNNDLRDLSGPYTVLRSDENGMLGQGWYDAYVSYGWLICALVAIALILWSAGRLKGPPGDAQPA